jgi:hypothetical protein
VTQVTDKQRYSKEVSGVPLGQVYHQLVLSYDRFLKEIIYQKFAGKVSSLSRKAMDIV